MKIKICIPSYRRPKVETYRYLETPYVYVDSSDYEAYRAQNKGHEEQIICVPDGVQGNIARVRNYIMRQVLEREGYDAVCIIDDDMRAIYRWVAMGNHSEKRKITEGELLELLQNYTEMCDELGYKYWGLNCNMDTLSYR